MNKILFNGDSKEELKKVQDNSVDFMATDPPYGYKFMGLDFDKALPDRQIWKESFRVLKEGSFICVMAAPRTDVLWRICRDLEEAGFEMSFSNIEWVYHTGFPKASDTSKHIDKRGGTYVKDLGVMLKDAREKNGLTLNDVAKHFPSKTGGITGCVWNWETGTNYPTIEQLNKLIEILNLDILKVEKVYGNIIGKKISGIGKAFTKDGWGTGSDEVDITEPATDLAKKYEGSKLGFQPKPAREIIIVGMKPFKEKSYIDKVLNFEELPENIQRTYPLIQTPKPSKKEKQIGVDKNNHPTIKPIKLMSYLITLFTREGDYVLDPFMGSGTTGLACKLLNRNFIGIDFTEEYFDIAEERLQVSREELIKTLKIKVQGELF